MRDGPTSLAQPHQVVHQTLGAAQHGQVASDTNVRLWHKVRVQLGAFEGTKTAALPTLRAERRFSGAFQTLRRGVVKVGT